ncbi:MAG: MerC domain-containing protein [Pseudomonadota bacterium]|nr:MerC domain-containing protein [Pseudomonadota bacterium]
MELTQRLGDKIAIALSSLCVIHCLATPLILIILPSLGALVADNHEMFHQVILFFVLPVGVLALWAGYRHHHNLSILLIGLAGLGLLLIAAFFGHDYFGETGETALTIFASLIIATAHVRNFISNRNVQSNRNFPSNRTLPTGDCHHD